MIKSNIILLGYMGSGKTVIGRQTARLLEMEFADTDEMISQVTGLNLQQLLRKHGEIRFRSEERLAIGKLARREQLVIACGGSLPPTPDDLRLLTERGYMVLLTADPAAIAARLSRKNSRPVGAGRLTTGQIAALSQERCQALAPLAQLTLDTSALSVEEAAEAIAVAFREQGELPKHCGNINL